MLKELLKTLIRKPINDNFNATKAFSVAKYGKEITGAQIYLNWIKEIENEIKYQSYARSYSYIVDIPEDKEKYLEDLIFLFKSKGFSMNLISNDTLKDYSGKSKFVLITWDKVSLD